MSTTARSWTIALVSSGVAHVALVIVLGLLPEGEARSGGASRRDDLFTPGAVVPIEAISQPMQVAMKPTPRERPRLPSEPPPTEPAAAPTDRPISSTPAPAGVDPVEPTPAEAQPHDRPGLMSGLREQSRGASQTGKVVVDPALLSGSRKAFEAAIEQPGVGEGAVQGPSPAPSSSKDFSFTREKGKLVYRDPGGRFVATLRSDGRVDFKNKAGKMSWTDNAIGDPSSLLRKASGEDPYASVKAKLLEATFELRLGMAVTFQKQQLDKRLARLESELGKIWTDEKRDLGKRKRLIFERWDECDEPEELPEGSKHALPGFGEVESSDLDEARRDTASEARETIESFVRKHAPKGSAEEFTAAELAEMNGRRVSKAKFDPYR